LLGEGGTYAGALEVLRSEAHRKAADYVQITDTRVPYSDGNCLHNEYVISGVAYVLPKTEAKLDSLGEPSDVVSSAVVNEQAANSTLAVDPSEPDWKNFAFPASHFYPKPFRLANGQHRWDARQVDAKRNLWGEGEDRRVISLVNGLVTDVDGDGVSEAWILLTYGEGEGAPPSGVPRPPTAVFVFRLVHDGVPEPIGTVVSKEGLLSLRDGAVVQGDQWGDDTSASTLWTLSDGRLHAEIDGVEPEPGRMAGEN
jgi:hypothetical protein